MAIILQTANLRVENPAPGTAVLWLDVADRSMNVLSRQVLADLDVAFDHVGADPALKTLTIRSAKASGFLAGADLNDFAAIRTAEEASFSSLSGQSLFDKLAALPVITTAVIHGPCLGGGLELALACDYRIVIDHPRTQIGFPEIDIGLLPGWGGTQRLPRVIGLENSLQMILGRKRLNAQEVVNWGLADMLLALPDPCANVEIPATFAQKRPKTNLPLHTWRQKLLESTSLGRLLIYRTTEKLLSKKVPDDMPAPWEALNAVRAGLAYGMDAGLEFERAATGRLAMTPACRHLIGLFFQREAARKPPASAEPAAQVRRVGIVGAGTMGAGIAQLAAVKGFEVVVQEVNDAALAAGMIKIETLLQNAAEHGVLSADEGRQKFASIGRTTSWQGFADVDLVVEAVIEEVQAKRKIFRELAARTKPTALLATNTSSLTVAQLQDGLHQPERVVGLHFFNPVHKMPLVEVVRTATTPDSAIAALTAWTSALGKTPVVVKDSPGFLVNRILFPYFFEALHLLGEGMSVTDIDRTMKRFGMPMGPLELLDQVGLDVAAHIYQAMIPHFGIRFPQNPAFVNLQQAGLLGQKSGKGFYLYEGKKPRENPSLPAVLNLKVASQKAPQREAQERMVLLMVNEAAQCLGEGLAADAATIDLAMVFGTGWAPHRGGPLHYADDRGLKRVVQALEDLAKKCGSRFEPCAELRRRAEKEEAFCTERRSASDAVEL